MTPPLGAMLDAQRDPVLTNRKRKSKLDDFLYMFAAMKTEGLDVIQVEPAWEVDMLAIPSWRTLYLARTHRTIWP